jgi:hypothetical protein
MTTSAPSLRASSAASSLRRAAAAGTLAAALVTPTVAAAQEPWIATTAPEPSEAAPAPMPAPPPRPVLVLPPGGVPSNVTTFPDGSVSVTRTPDGGVDVHAQTAAGTVHAYGCSRVDVDARTATGAAAPPCPVTPYPYPFPYYAPYPVAPYYYAPLRLEAPKPKHLPDPARTGALIASSLVFGLGTAVAGTAYVVSVADRSTTTCDSWGTGGCQTRSSEPNKPALYAMGGIMTVTPSIPRYVVGDVGLGLLFTALRGGSFAAGAFVDWKDKTSATPVMLAFVVPLAIGVVDLATTPHRDKELERAQAKARPKTFELAGVGPSAIPDHAGNLAPSVAAMGRF